MKAILFILWKEFVQLRRDPRLFTVIFISPILQLLLLGYAANLDVKNIPSVVCDLDRSAAGREFLDGFLNSGYFKVAARVDRMDGIDPFLDNGESSMAFVIPRGFGDDRAAGGTARKPWVPDVLRQTAISHYFRATGSYGRTVEQFRTGERRSGKSRRQDHEEEPAESTGDPRSVHLARLHPARSDCQRRAPAIDRGRWAPRDDLESSHL